MSARNTGLFVHGHVPPEAIVRALRAWSGFSTDTFAGEEGPRVGHAEWSGQPTTHVALRVFEVAGFRLLDEDDIPEDDDLEMVLGRELSRAHGPVVLAQYEDEAMAGGGARFEAGRLVYRCCIDGRDTRPVRRDLDGTAELTDLDASHWIWPLASEALGSAFGAHWPTAPRSDDDLERLIIDARAAAVPLDQPSEQNPSAPPRKRKRDRLKGWLSRTLGRPTRPT